LKPGPVFKNAPDVGATILPPEAVAIVASLTSLGTLSSPFVTTGRSGVKHTFTFGTSDANGANIVCDIVAGSAPADETKVLSLFIKIYDVGAKYAILCAIPSLTAEARKLSNLYKMLVIEAATVDSAISLVTEALRRLAKG
jgi:hypothetical protein